jgi:type IX secretion system PorP/SprF family membrane protein
MKHLKNLSLLACVVSSLQLNAQLASRMDQYMHDPAIINPASINTYTASRLSFFNNRLYGDIPGSPSNMLASFSMPVPKKNIGVGAYFGQEKLGFTTLSNAYASYAYTIPLSGDQRLHLAASLGFLNQKFNGNSMHVVHPNDPVYTSYLRGQSTSRFDVKFSALYQLQGLTLGISSGRIANPRFVYENANYSSTFSLQNLSNAYAAAKLQVSDALMLQPVVSVHLIDFKRSSLQYGMNAWIEDVVWAGFHNSGNKNLSLHLGARLFQTILAGYAYSMPINPEATLLGSGHEFFTSFIISKPHKENQRLDMLVLGGNGTERPVAEEEVEEEAPEQNTLLKIPATVHNLTEMKALRPNYDTAYLTISPLNNEVPEAGFYVCVGMNKSEHMADKLIKELYTKGLRSYKFQNSKNKYYYVYLTKKSTRAEADNVKLSGVAGVENIWTVEVGGN